MCTWFSDESRCGYLRPDEVYDKEDVFVHTAALRDLGWILRSGDPCSFRVAMVNGRECAQDVTGADGFTGYDYKADPRTHNCWYERRGGGGRHVYPDFWKGPH